MPIPIRDIKPLWGRAASRCSFPECRRELTHQGHPGILGEMAHIVADNGTGPRGTSPLSDGERDRYPNLILLCPTHHTLVDNDPMTWTVERLDGVKKTHEEWVEAQLSKGLPWKANLASVDYLNVPRILFELAAEGRYPVLPAVDVGRS